jgi:ATPase subunit of ABC transporter with duplicated ATPase domains
MSADRRRGWAWLLLRPTQPNFYLLDEPTNHLDIEGQEEELEDEHPHCADCVEKVLFR